MNTHKEANKGTEISNRGCGFLKLHVLPLANTLYKVHLGLI